MHDAALRGRVLIVEDDAVTRELMCDLLEDDGYEVEVATSGAEALLRLGQQLPDLVVLDLMLPDGDGLAFLRRRRDLAPFAAIPVLVVSAAASEHLVDAKNLGADALVYKPFDIDALLLQARALSRSAPGSPHG